MIWMKKMISGFKFNYKTFYDYYTNPDNIIRDDSKGVNMYFYNDKTNKPKPAKKSADKYSYIEINGSKIYVSESNKLRQYKDRYGKMNPEYTYGLLFSIPTVINGEIFDFHYNFGMRTHTKYVQVKDKIFVKPTTAHQIEVKERANATRKRGRPKKETVELTEHSLSEYEPEIGDYPIDSSEKLIYFHKTIQHPETIDGKMDKQLRGKFEHIECHFQDNTQIRDINNIVCIDKDEHTMGSLFSELDKLFINEIISRPFLKLRGGRKIRRGRRAMRM